MSFRAMRIRQAIFQGAIISLVALGMLLAGCRAGETGDRSRLGITPSAPPVQKTANPGRSATEWSASAGAPQGSLVCPVTEPTWAKPPDDAAVQDPPSYGYYFINPDGSMWASAWWTGKEAEYLRAGEEGVKVGWFRPPGATLEISGRRLDAPAPPLEGHTSCCYPTRFQASGLYFPTPGCWEVSARAAGSKLSFVVWVQP